MPALRKLVSISAIILCACAINTNIATANPDNKPAVETFEIQAVRETVPVASPGDAADDPAIWRNPADPTKSLIVGTDKEWGLHVYDLSGALLASAPAGLVNNVDLRADVLINGKPGVLVAATDRSEDPNGKLALYALETSPVGLRHLGHPRVEGDGVGDVYGFCLWRRAADQVFAIIAYNNGDVREYALNLTTATPTAKLVRDVRLATRTEGCVVDDRTGLLYVGEERHGIWRMDAAHDSKASPVLFAAVDGVRLIPDIEGLAIIPEGKRGGVLIASSQNDNAYVAYDLETGRYLRRFRVTGSGTVDGVTDTDGLEFAPGDFGAPFQDGLFVVQDGDNSPDKQNFKLIPGGALKKLLPR
ncbi:phytase [Caulobacter sp.]|uniref:phytase n=1 Tax=Caulobacter sp. TaxID=78 RepID=UPI001B1035FD|nr:phytase [Caulobacter sp.]MBO9545449.1 phytase [Caulobacter sp.]